MKQLSTFVRALLLICMVFGLVLSGRAQNNALRFDGSDDKITFTSDVLLSPISSAWTICAWINVDEDGVLISNINGSNQNSHGMAVRIEGNKVVARVQTNEPFISGYISNYIEATSTSNFPNGWHHLAVSYTGTGDAAGFKIYVDGSSVNDNDSNFGNLTSGSGGPTKIGAGAAYANFDGRIDDLRYYTFALTAQQIADNQFDCFATSPAPYRWYEFNQGVAAGDNSGITSLDASAGPDGTLVGFSMNGTNSNFVNGYSTFGASCCECTDPAACSYNASALCTDNSLCIYPRCSNVTACNYQGGFTCVDNSTCVFPGCINSSACNYDSTAGCGDGSCVYPGCTNSTACNYNSSAACDDGSCILPDGCTDSLADNYNSNAQCDDGSCTYEAYSLHFDGSNDKILLANPTGWDLSIQPFTIESWIKPDASGIIFSSRPNGADYTGIVFRINGDQQLQMTLANSSSNTTSIVCQSVDTITFDTWVHVALVYDGSGDANGVQFFIDGVDAGLVVEENGLVGAAVSTTAPIIGARPSSVSNEFSGFMDELRIWTRNLCADEIANNLGCSLDGLDSDLYALYIFEQGSAGGDNTLETTLLDQGPLGLDGTLLNFELTGSTSNWVAHEAVKDGSCGGHGLGCTDSSACNYDSTAICDDGFCMIPDGCTDSTACNYDSTAQCDDGSCTFPGCTNSLACNYDSIVGCDDGSCVVPDGCTDSTACNYDSTALCDDGSCLLPDGCTDSSAVNWISTAVCDDGSCLYSGTSLHFDGANDRVFLTDALSWDLTIQPFTFEAWIYHENGGAGTLYSNRDVNGTTTGQTWRINGSQELQLTIANSTVGSADIAVSSIATVSVGEWQHVACTYDGSGSAAGVRFYINGIDAGASIGDDGLVGPSISSTAAAIGVRPGSTVNEFEGWIDEMRIWDIEKCDAQIFQNMGCDFVGMENQVYSLYRFNQGVGAGDNPTVNTLQDDGFSANSGTLENFSLTGSISNWSSEEASKSGVCTDTTGCTDSEACNFDSTALCDDGSCVYAGCTNSLACNYDSTAGCDDGSCILPDGCTDSMACNYDSTALCDDGSCILPDGCTDSSAVNWNSTANCDDGSCQYAGTSIHFDGNNDRVFLDNPLPWDLTSQPFTFEAWIFDQNFQSGTLYSNRNVFGSTIGQTWRVNEDQLLQLTVSNNSIDSESILVTSIATVNIDVWQHVACTYDGSGTAAGVRFYIDGVDAGLAVVHDGLVGPTVSLLNPAIGVRPQSADNEFEGWIDEMRIWDVERCEAQIAQNMGCDFVGQENQLYSLYRFNQGVDEADNSAITILVDDGFSANSGILANFSLNGAMSNWSSEEATKSGLCEDPTGCADMSACNYDSTALCDDGSCVFPGCLDSTACNYDSTAGCDDGSCQLAGCVDTSAINFNSLALCDDGSCQYLASGLHFSNSGELVDLGNLIQWDLDQPFSFEAMIQYDDAGHILSNSDGSFFGFGIHWYVNNENQLQLTLKGGSADQQLRVNSAELLSADWTHVAVTYDGSALASGVNMYINGVAATIVVETDGLTSTILSSYSTYLGSGATGGNLPVGEIDEVRVWKRELCPDEILSNMACEVLPTGLNLEAYYSFDHGVAFGENAGETTLSDVTGNGNDGTLTGFSLSGNTSNWSLGFDFTTTCSAFALGCMDSSACNYDSTALCDDGSCLFPDGCTDSVACNYDPTALCDDGSCILPNGCVDSTACNYDSTATCDDGSCILPDGCTDPLAVNYDSTATCDDGSCSFMGCTYSTACNYEPLALYDDGSCDYASCVITGCTYPDALNYNSTAVVDDGSCVFDSCTNACPSDLNGDGLVNTNDLLLFLGNFGTTCPE